MKQSIQTDVPFGGLRRSVFDRRQLAPDLETVKSSRLSVLPRDGV